MRYKMSLSTKTDILVWFFLILTLGIMTVLIWFLVSQEMETFLFFTALMWVGGENLNLLFHYQGATGKEKAQLKQAIDKYWQSSLVVSLIPLSIFLSTKCFSFEAAMFCGAFIFGAFGLCGQIIIKPELASLTPPRYELTEAEEKLVALCRKKK